MLHKYSTGKIRVRRSRPHSNHHLYTLSVIWFIFTRKQNGEENFEIGPDLFWYNLLICEGIWNVISTEVRVWHIMHLKKQLLTEHDRTNVHRIALIRIPKSSYILAFVIIQFVEVPRRLCIVHINLGSCIILFIWFRKTRRL